MSVSHPFCAISASVDENQLAGAASHDDRHCTRGANRTRANYSDFHEAFQSVVGLSEAIGTTNLSESQKRNRAAQIAIPQPGKRCTFHR